MDLAMQTEACDHLLALAASPFAKLCESILDDLVFRIDPNSGSPTLHRPNVSKCQTKDRKAHRDDWCLDSHEPQGHEASLQDKDKIDAQSRQVFSISMAGYQATRKELPNVLNDAKLVEETFGRLGYTVTNCAKDVEKETLHQMFQQFLHSLNTRTYAVILHMAGHGQEHDGHLILNLVDGSKVFVDDLFRSLNMRLDELVLSSQSDDDFVHDVGILVIWDACRERPDSQFSIPRRAKCRKKLRERQQALIHSCMSGGQSLDSLAGSNQSPFMVALGGLLGANTPFNVFEFAENLNARVKKSSKGMQSVEWSAEATKLNHRYDWFVDLEKCNQLRIFDVRLKRLQAESNDVEACARLVSLWKVPCKSKESSEDCLQSLQDSQQRLLSDLRCGWMDSTVNAEQRGKDAEQAKNAALERAKDANSRAGDAEQQTKDAVQAKDAALEKARAAESLLAQAQQRAKDAERCVAQKEEEKTMLERRNKDAEKRAAEAQEAARIAKGQIIAVCRQVASCLNEDAPGQTALRQFCRRMASKFPDVDAAFSETLVHKAVEQSILRDARKIKPPCGGTWTNYYGVHPTLCEGSKYFGCHIHVGSSSEGFRCSKSCHTLCYMCFEKIIAENRGLCPNCMIAEQRASEAAVRAVQAEEQLQAVQAGASEATVRAVQAEELLGAEVSQATLRAVQAEEQLRAVQAGASQATLRAVQAEEQLRAVQARASQATLRAVQAEEQLRAVQAGASQATLRAVQAEEQLRAVQAESRLRAYEATQQEQNCTTC